MGTGRGEVFCIFVRRLDHIHSTLTCRNLPVVPLSRGTQDIVPESMLPMLGVGEDN